MIFLTLNKNTEAICTMKWEEEKMSEWEKREAKTCKFA